MDFDEYQKKAISTDVFGGKGDVMSIAFVNQILGLVGEAGEVAEKIKKIQRNNKGTMSTEERDEILKELGDTLWYLAAVSYYLDASLADIAKSNLAKLQDRQRRDVIASSGDNR